MNAKLFSVFCIVLMLGVLPLGYVAQAAPDLEPSGSLELAITSKENREVEASGTYTDSFGSWATCLYWGDGASVCYDGVSGTFTDTHQYPAQGTYTVTLVVEGEGVPFEVSQSVSFYDSPDGRFTVIVDNDTFAGTVSGRYENVADWGACINFGDGSPEVCFPGSEGEFLDVPHIWPGLGTYVVALRLVGAEETVILTDRVYFFDYVYIPIVVTSGQVPTPPSGSLEVVISDPSTREIMASGEYWNAVDWGACIDWGDGQKVCFSGFSGTFSDVPHQYAHSGSYTVTLTVTGAENTTPFVTTKEVNVP